MFGLIRVIKENIEDKLQHKPRSANMTKTITLKNGQEIVFPKGKRFAILYRRNRRRKRNTRWLISFHRNQKLVLAKQKELYGMTTRVIDSNGTLWFPALFRENALERFDSR